VAVGLASALALRGHSIHLVARTPPPGSRRASGVTFHGLRGGRERLTSHLQADWSPLDLESFLDLVLSVIASADLDVLHFHYAVPFGEIAARVRHRLGAAGPRLVMTLHGTDVSALGGDPDTGRVMGRTLTGLDALTTVSDSHARLSADVFGFERPPEVIPNFVDLQRFRPRRALEFPGRVGIRRRPRIAHVSNFRPVKDPERVARIFARVRDQLDAELWLIGDGDGMSSVRSILRGAGVERDVRFFGLRREIHRILPSSDLLLLTSRTESFCLAALEAAACGVPAVAPRVGGLPEVVAESLTGLLYEAGDEEEAVRAALRLVVDDERRLAMGRAAVRRARLFSRERIVAWYERLYGDVLDGGAGVRYPAPATTTVFSVAGA
jgi:N-acetyl-alpha-D-glucosaminyl L-malate synthase BshA